ncbi:MauE/DoxX family redox-associated membrane protein [Luedemannella helvata]|uniref:DoxX family membrane protein n=1 Tax=Luedemannella helvata TaxID=349315 RepID=A0ABP4WM84_9ACTN
MDVTSVTTHVGAWARVRPWIGLIARVVLAGVFLFAGGTKVGDLAASGRAVHAYELMPYGLATAVGAALPFIEIAIGLLLLLGLATRLAGVLSAVLLSVFIAGIASVWARGLSIDCGCFGSGGELAPGQSPQYGSEIARDVVLLALAVFLVAYPRTPLSVDAYVLGDVVLEDDHEQQGEEQASQPGGTRATGA